MAEVVVLMLAIVRMAALVMVLLLVPCRRCLPFGSGCLDQNLAFLKIAECIVQLVGGKMCEYYVDTFQQGQAYWKLL